MKYRVKQNLTLTMHYKSLISDIFILRKKMTIFNWFMIHLSYWCLFWIFFMCNFGSRYV